MIRGLRARLARRGRGPGVPVVIGLTGSIGMGKSTTAAMARRMGVWVHDADAAVHALLGLGGGAVAAVAAAFPGVMAAQGGIDRRALGRRVFDDPAALARLEAILHPRVRAAERAFLRRATLARRRLVILDIPLLYETDGAGRCDRVLVVRAPPLVRDLRVLRRPGMTRATLERICARQMPDAAKARRADAVIPTGLGRRVALRALRAALLGARQTIRPAHGRRRGGRRQATEG